MRHIEPGELERLARTISRAPFALGKINVLGKDHLRADTRPHPETGATHVELDGLANPGKTASTG